MPTRLNRTSIGVSDQVRDMFNQYRQDTESWDAYIIRLIQWVKEAEVKLNIQDQAPNL